MSLNGFVFHFQYSATYFHRVWPYMAVKSTGLSKQLRFIYSNRVQSTLRHLLVKDKREEISEVRTARGSQRTVYFQNNNVTESGEIFNWLL